MDQGRVLDDVRHWASTEEHVRLVVLTGSVAREGHAADELSDLDIELYVLDTPPLLNHRQWYQRFGQVTRCVLGTFLGQETAAALSASVGLFDSLSRHTAFALGIEPFDGDSVVQEIDRVMRLTGGTGEQPDGRSE